MRTPEEVRKFLTTEHSGVLAIRVGRFGIQLDDDIFTDGDVHDQAGQLVLAVDNWVAMVRERIVEGLPPVTLCEPLARAVRCLRKVGVPGRVAQGFVAEAALNIGFRGKTDPLYCGQQVCFETSMTFQKDEGRQGEWRFSEAANFEWSPLLPSRFQKQISKLA